MRDSSSHSPRLSSLPCCARTGTSAAPAAPPSSPPSASARPTRTRPPCQCRPGVPHSCRGPGGRDRTPGGRAWPAEWPDHRTSRDALRSRDRGRHCPPPAPRAASSERTAGTGELEHSYNFRSFQLNPVVSGNIGNVSGDTGKSGHTCNVSGQNGIVSGHTGKVSGHSGNECFRCKVYLGAAEICEGVRHKIYFISCVF